MVGEPTPSPRARCEQPYMYVAILQHKIVHSIKAANSNILHVSHVFGILTRPTGSENSLEHVVHRS